MSGSSHKPLIVLDYAIAENGVIGKNGDLAWRIPSDLKRFKARTLGCPIIMGRRTFESIGRPLPKRRNIVVTSNQEFAAEGVEITRSPSDALQLAQEKGVERIIVIGGATIYEQLMPHADRLVVTHVHGHPDGDTIMPPVDEDIWQVVSETPHEAEEGDDYATTVRVYERR